MKILILVLSYNDGGCYTNFLNTQISTWDSIEVDGISTYYYLGNSDKSYIDGKFIHTNVSESLMNCTKKTIKSFELIKDFDFDFVFRTNSSSYIDKVLLKNYLEDKPKNNFYSGIIGEHESIPFCSGSGYFLSKNLIELLVTKQNELNHNLIDDVSISQLLIRNNVTLTNSSRFDVTDINNINLDFFHYRLKTNNRKPDMENMKKIFELKCSL